MIRSFLSPPRRAAVRAARLVVILAALTSQTALNACASESPEKGGSAYEERLPLAYAKLEERGFSGIIAIAEEGKQPVYKRFGETAPKGAAAKDILVDSGSITKTFTAAAAVKLVEDGKLKTSDKLVKYFSDAPEDKANITVHQLLTHSAGFTHEVADDYDQIGKDEFIKRAMASDLLFKPGSDYAYSNVGYSIAAVIIEKITGKSYERYLKEDVLGGRGLDSIGYAAAYKSDRALTTADGKTIPASSWGGDKAYWALIGNGGLLMSVGDMVKFRRLFAAGEIVSPAAAQLAQTPMVREGENAPSFYGYGMVVEDHPDFGRTYWHNGGSPGFTANWTDYADKGLIVVTASNAPNFNADFAQLTILEALFDMKIFPDEYDFAKQPN